MVEQNGLVIDMAVLKMKIGETAKDDREETSGLTTKLSFEVVGSPRSLARMANVIKQGNCNITLSLKATNVATDVTVETVEVPHQMQLGETPKADKAAKDRGSVQAPAIKVNLCTVCGGFEACTKAEKATGVKECTSMVAKAVKAAGTDNTTEPAAGAKPAADTENVKKEDPAGENTGVHGATGEVKSPKGRKKKGAENKTPADGEVSSDTIACKNCEYSGPRADFTATGDKPFCPACGNPVDISAVKNLENTAPLIDLKGFEIRPSNGPAVPAKIFYNKDSEEVVNDDVKTAVLRIIGRANIQLKFNKPEDLAAVFQKYPKTDERDQVLEILESKLVTV